MKKILFFSVAISMLLSMMAKAEHWPTGFYQAVYDPDNSFYYNDENRWYCHIQNETQASLYEVEAQIRIVGDISFLNQGVSLNECPWFNGFYQVAEGPVYRLYPGNICTITSEAMLAAYNGTDSVIVAEENSNFGAQRTNIGQCFWPSFE